MNKLDEYLKDEFYEQIFAQNADDGWPSGFTPIAFFDRLEELFRFIRANKKRPSVVLDRIKQERNTLAKGPNPESRSHGEAAFRRLLFQLARLIRYRFPTAEMDTDWRRCSRMIEAELSCYCRPGMRQTRSILCDPSPRINVLKRACARYSAGKSR